MATHNVSGKNTATTRTGPVNLEIIKNINYNNITMLGKQKILFVWQDELEDELKTTTSGILIYDKLKKERPRWGKVVLTTKDSTVKVGEWIMPEKTDQPFGTVIDELEHWCCADNDVIMATEDFNIVQTLVDA